MRGLKKLFGGLRLSWITIIISAVAAGVYTALVAILPQTQDTSFDAIAASFEVWILLGILIIMNAESNKDAALKCFVFFLISQPLVYLLQVPFSWQGWGLFQYYPRWFVWTVLCLPMGYLGYYIKKDKWWGYVCFLLPMTALTAVSYHQYLTFFTFCYPDYILISIFCAAAMIIYPVALFNNKKIVIAGTVISVLAVVGITVWVALNPYRYSADILSAVDGQDVTDAYTVSVADEKLGDVAVRYIDSVDAYMIHGDFRKTGTTKMTVTDPEGRVTEYELIVTMNSYELNVLP